jgi:hypothetical protein
MKVQLCEIIPPSVSAGATAQLVVSLDTPAPAGGQEVAIGTRFNGSSSSIMHIPQGIPVRQGELSGSFTLQTVQVDENPSTEVTFSAAVIGQTPAAIGTLQIT